MFGFSYKPPLRKPFDEIIPILNKCDKPIFAIDIPSGWNVEKGNSNNEKESLLMNKKNDGLISLTAPKLGVKEFKGVHYVGGRFVPDGWQRNTN
eukprot:UN20053